WLSAGTIEIGVARTSRAESSQRCTDLATPVVGNIAPQLTEISPGAVRRAAVADDSQRTTRLQIVGFMDVTQIHGKNVAGCKGLLPRGIEPNIGKMIGKPAGPIASGIDCGFEGECANFEGAAAEFTLIGNAAVGCQAMKITRTRRIDA